MVVELLFGEFNGDVVAGEAGVVRAVDLPHAAGTDERDDLIRSEPGVREIDWQCTNFQGY